MNLFKFEMETTLELKPGLFFVVNILKPKSK
jgi:hypothetical protein